MHNNDLFVTSLKVKGQLNEPQQFFVQPKAFEPLCRQRLGAKYRWALSHIRKVYFPAACAPET